LRAVAAPHTNFGMSSTLQPIQSPCIKVCVLDPASGFCIGCRRTLREIAAWGSMPPQMRDAIMNELPKRSFPEKT